MSLLPRDAVLPQLPLALDPAAMAQVFAEVLRPHGMRVDACHIERVKYRPGRNAVVGYRLSLHDGGFHALEQHVTARLCGDRGAASFEGRSASALQPSRAGPSMRCLPALEMVTWWWPNDPKMRAPGTLTDPTFLREHLLPELMPALGADAADAAGVQASPVELVRYVPGQRLCARVDLRWHSGAEVHERRVYCKAQRNDGRVGHAVLEQVQASQAWREGRLHTPRAYLWHAASETSWQEGLPGQALLDAAPQLQLACAPGIGAQLAALHATPMVAPAEVSAAGMRQELAEVVRVLSPVLGAAGLNETAQALLDHWPALADGGAANTLHGDFHGRNILVEDRPGAQPALIDLDCLCRGPGVLELGSWIADAIYRALVAGDAPDRGRPVWRAFIDGYVAAGGHRPSPAELAWSVGWNLLMQRARRCVIKLKVGRFELAPRLVQLAREMASARGCVELS
jgi:hypothetical protein